MVYFSDIGLRNYMLGIFGNLVRPDDLGLAFQNLVFLIGWVEGFEPSTPGATAQSNILYLFLSSFISFHPTLYFPRPHK